MDLRLALHITKDDVGALKTTLDSADHARIAGRGLSYLAWFLMVIQSTPAIPRSGDSWDNPYSCLHNKCSGNGLKRCKIWFLPSLQGSKFRVYKKPKTIRRQ